MVYERVNNKCLKTKFLLCTEFINMELGSSTSRMEIVFTQVGLLRVISFCSFLYWTCTMKSVGKSADWREYKITRHTRGLHYPYYSLCIVFASFVSSSAYLSALIFTLSLMLHSHSSFPIYFSKYFDHNV